jgi:hypothetical protein
VLRITGGVTVLAFGAALMPEPWFVTISLRLGQDFADLPLTYYLARHLSVMYGLIGLGLLVIASDLQRYGPLVPWLSWGAIALGGLQLVIDQWSGLPAWWTWGESLSTIAGGLMLLGLSRWCRATGT